jgi:2-dehydropantoate 2-reductase
MKIAVVGPGALGCLIAGLLKSKTKEEVWLIDKPIRTGARRIKDDNIRIEGLSGTFAAKLDILTQPKGIGRVDLAIISVKSYATEDAAKSIKDIVGANTHVLTLQNGLGNVQILNDYFGRERVIAGVTSHGATLLAPGHARHAGKGETIIGRSDGRVLGFVRDVSGLLSKAGFETKVSKDIDSVIWSKLIINAGINAVTAITRLPNGKILEHDGAREVMRGAVQEAVKVAKRKKIKLAYDDPIQKVESVCKGTASNISSMLQDVLNKKRTEIDFINGAISRQAKALGIQTPVNDALTNLVKAIEASYQEAIK